MESAALKIRLMLARVPERSQSSRYSSDGLWYHDAIGYLFGRACRCPGGPNARSAPRPRPLCRFSGGCLRPRGNAAKQNDPRQKGERLCHMAYLNSHEFKQIPPFRQVPAQRCPRPAARTACRPHPRETPNLKMASKCLLVVSHGPKYVAWETRRTTGTA